MKNNSQYIDCKSVSNIYLYERDRVVTPDHLRGSEFGVAEKPYNNATVFASFRHLTAETVKVYIARTSPPRASALGREAAPSGAAFAFSGMSGQRGGHFL